VVRKTLVALVAAIMLVAATLPPLPRLEVPVSQSANNYNPGVYIFEDYFFEDPQQYPFIKGSVFDLTWRQIDTSGGFGQWR
jgi:carbohydrate-binding DOMON domain-containing protein